MTEYIEKQSPELRHPLPKLYLVVHQTEPRDQRSSAWAYEESEQRLERAKAFMFLQLTLIKECLA